MTWSWLEIQRVPKVGVPQGPPVSRLPQASEPFLAPLPSHSRLLPCRFFPSCLCCVFLGVTSLPPVPVGRSSANPRDLSLQLRNALTAHRVPLASGRQKCLCIHTQLWPQSMFVLLELESKYVLLFSINYIVFFFSPFSVPFVDNL